MGSKIRAREMMQAAGVPIVPGTTERVDDPARVLELGEAYGWPIALKAAAGGGGKGLKVVDGAGRGRARAGRRAARGRRRTSAIRRSTSRSTSPTRATSRCS